MGEIQEFSLAPTADTDSENKIFKQLTLVFDKVVTVAQTVWEQECPEQRWALVTEPTATPKSPGRPSSIKLDGFFYWKVVVDCDMQSFTYNNIHLHL